MKHRYRYLLLAPLLSALLPIQVSANMESISKIGAEIRAYRPSKGAGVLYGWRYVHYRSDSFTIGGAGYTGQLNGTSAGAFSYGGLTAVYAGKLGTNTRIELGLLAGGGGGYTNDGSEAGGVLLEPDFAFGFMLGKTVELGLNAGYIYMPNSTTFSGLCAGVRMEFLIGEESVPPSAPKPPIP